MPTLAAGTVREPGNVSEIGGTGKNVLGFGKVEMSRFAQASEKCMFNLRVPVKRRQVLPGATRSGTGSDLLVPPSPAGDDPLSRRWFPQVPPRKFVYALGRAHASTAIQNDADLTLLEGTTFAETCGRYLSPAAVNCIDHASSRAWARRALFIYHRTSP